MDFDDREVDLVRENYDLAIRISADLAPGLIAKPLGKTSIRFYASPEHPDEIQRTYGTPAI